MGMESYGGPSPEEMGLGPEGESEKEKIYLPVSIDGKHLGAVVSKFDLNSFSEPMLGSDAFTEAIFETASGNQYLITKDKGGSFRLYNGNSNLGKGVDNMQGALLSDEDLRGTLRVGEGFRYGNGGQTTEITKITLVNTNKQYDSDTLQEMTGGTKSYAREQMRRLVEE